ncbi:MAG: DUF3108 domain-containing protein [Candidatus Omnitrophica bacterium]|nr:DUF3108 domain-containing protein [Candidatus Omnitrophota bacterium]
MKSKNLFLLGLILCFLTACETVTKKDILLQAQRIKIKAATATENTKPAYHEETSPVITDNATQETSKPETMTTHTERVEDTQEAENILVPQAPPIQDNLSEYERLVYKAKYLGISIGEFIVQNNGKTILNGREAYSFELTVKTSVFFKKLFSTKDRYISYMDPKRFVVLRHEEYINEGTKLESIIDFDYETHMAFYKNVIDQSERKIKIPDRVLDVLSGSFYLRMFRWGLGDTVEINLYADDILYNFLGLLHSKANVQLPTKETHEAFLLKPYVFSDGKPIKKISAEVFLATTGTKKPLRAILKTPLGNIAVVLYEGFDDL